MPCNQNGRRGKWAVGVGAVAIATGLLASLGLGATPATAAQGWNGNGAPAVLKTAPAGTSISAPAKNTMYACVETPAPNGTVLPDGTTLPDGSLLDIGQEFGRTLTKANTPWLQGNNVVLSKIETVPGKVKMKSVFKITETKNTRTLKGNGIPSFEVGTFAIPKSSPAYKYYAALPAAGYANAAEIPIKPYHLELKIPKNPKIAAKPTCFEQLTIGVALVGAAWHAEVALDALGNAYDPNAALPTDRCFGHPYATEYHVHGYSWKCMDQGKPGEASPLVGYALDGFGIYGPRGADGTLVTNAQLDECHGRVGEVMWNGKKQKIYHYVLNNEYPYSIGCFRGTPQKFIAPDQGPMKGMHH
jgi:hypothetical protein